MALSPMLEALTAPGPFPDHREKMMLFGRLVGSWDVESRFLDPDGKVTREHRGEWIFDWVLEGRAIQDVLISPPRAGRKPGEQSHEYGTTLRAYDPKNDVWRITFEAPVYGGVATLVAREHGDEIWLEGPSPSGGLYRWTFSDITAERFTWRGYESHDGGATWLLGEEIFAYRSGA
jgi:hypothetical protein